MIYDNNVGDENNYKTGNKKCDKRDYDKGMGMEQTINVAIQNELPKTLQDFLKDEEYKLDDIGMSGSQILLFRDKVLKIQPDGLESQNEIAMLKWLEGKLAVPKILYHTVQNEKSYLLMSRVPGKMSCDKEYLEQPRVLAKLLAEGLKTLWSIDVSDCPITSGIDAKLAVARKAVENDEIDMEDAEPETFGEGGFKNPAELLAWLEENRPEEEMVLSHGDYCLPNIFFMNKMVSGFIDMGRSGVADKWLDIAICYRSLKHNYDGTYTGEAYEGFQPELLFEELEIETDWDKIKYYILLDELF